MEKCKFCDAELEEGVTLCPSCGKDNAEEAVAEETVAETTETVVEETVEEAAEETAEAAAEVVEAPTEGTTEIQEGIKVTPGKIALAVVAIIVLVALIVALLFGGMAGKSAGETVPAETMETVETTPPTIPEDGNPDDETCKGSYTVSDEEAVAGSANVVATMGDKELTNGDLQLQYWNYINNYLGSEEGYQVMMYGLLNFSQPLDTQLCIADQNLTWQQYFLKRAIQNWQTLQATALEAEAQGHSLPEEIQAQLDSLPEDMAAMAAENGAESVEQLLAQNMGAGVTLENFIRYQEVYYQGALYFEEATAAFVPTQEEIEAFFTENEDAYAQQGLTREDKMVDVRHVLIMPEGATSATIRSETFSDEAWAAAEQEANELLETWKQGDKTEDSFAEMANAHTDDGNDANGDGVKDGGLYTGVTKGQMVEAFENWCFDESREIGDVGIVKTEFGYHIMYYVGGEVVWPYYAEQDWMAVKENEFLMGIVNKYPMEVDYSAIQLAAVPMM